MNRSDSAHNIILHNTVICSSNPVLNKDNIADFVSIMNNRKEIEKEQNGNANNLNSVKEIQLNSINISNWGLFILIPCILRSRSLVRINLSNNNLTNVRDSAKILSKCLNYVPWLTSLNLSNNLIKCEGGIAIIE
ncbi:LRR12 [Plasmodium brasilianum]|uniref:LRR12 n=1 Tax=Plasmodium brasilianum TaxID=5824 RepID=A0ACB9Y3Z3_PLABR|nr:LRR12 [Plasmodium brasilianum]